MTFTWVFDWYAEFYPELTEGVAATQLPSPPVQSNDGDDANVGGCRDAPQHHFSFPQYQINGTDCFFKLL